MSLSLWEEGKISVDVSFFYDSMLGGMVEGMLADVLKDLRCHCHHLSPPLSIGPAPPLAPRATVSGLVGAPQYDLPSSSLRL